MKKEKCLHEGDIFYGKLHQGDGTPQYEVVCQDCGREGITELVEGDNYFKNDKGEMELLKK